MKRIAIAFILIVVVLSFAACSSSGGISVVTMRTYEVEGIQYERYTFGFDYTQDMLGNYYEVLVEYGKTSFYIPQAQIYFQQVENANGAKEKVPNTKAMFSVNLAPEVTEISLTLVKLSKPSSDPSFEILQRVTKSTHKV